MAQININGINYVGRDIVMDGSSMYIDGVEIDFVERTVNVTITGDIDSLSAISGDIYVTGNVINVSAISGNINVKGNLGSAKTVSGDITKS